MFEFSSDYIIIPVSTAIIGYITNWLAIKMLFRPHNEIRLFGVKLPFTPGLIPKERHKLACKIGETVAEHLLTKDALSKAVTSDVTRAEIEKFVDGAFGILFRDEKTIGSFFSGDNEAKAASVYNIIFESIKSNTPNMGVLLKNIAEKNPELEQTVKQMLDKIIDENVNTLASFFIKKDKIFSNMKDSFFEYLNNEENNEFLLNKSNEILKKFTAAICGMQTSDILSNFSEENIACVKRYLSDTLLNALVDAMPHLVECINIKQLVEDQVNSFSVEQGEDILLSVVKRELSVITSLGGFLGFILGIFTVFLSL